MRHGYLILFLWVFVNQLGVPLPAIPYLLAAGALAGLGQLDLGLLVLLSVVATLSPDLIWYEVGRLRHARGLRAKLEAGESSTAPDRTRPPAPRWRCS